jgi:hypothetical protein
VKIYGPVRLEGQWMDKHGNWESENLNDVNKLIVLSSGISQNNVM